MPDDADPTPASLLDAVRIVLYEPQDPVNIAATIRAMKNMGVRDLVLVRPVSYNADRIEQIAHDTRDLVARIRHVGDLDEALADCVFVAGFAGKRRAAKWRLTTPRELAPELLGRAASGPVALLFGREDDGLPNEALDRAQVTVTVPTTEHASLNLAQAVLLALYELHLAVGDATRGLAPPRKDAEAATHDQYERLFADVAASLEALDFFKTRNPDLVVRSLRSLAYRADPDAREIELYRAMAIEVRRAMDRAHRAALPLADTRGPAEVGPAAEQRWRDRAAAVIPGAASTGSKRPAALFGDDDEPGPAHYTSAHGVRLTTVGGRELVDCTMALGAVAFGYADPAVTRAVIAAAAAGNTTGLSSALEVEVAERLCAVIPCADQVRFLKTGAEAVAAAVRIARAATGRARVIGSGYFGWLDWWSDAAGVPAGARADYTPIAAGDVAALDAAVAAAGSDLAAIIIEPVIERAPDRAWLHALRAACDRTGAVLIYDEIKTGFRVATGGWQAISDVVPDLATFGKAMANGLPLAAVVGRAAVMDAARRSWISSTLAGETVALAAARVVLDRHARSDVVRELAAIGERQQDAVRRALAEYRVDGVELRGIPQMWFLHFDDPGAERRYLRAAREAGVLFKRGAYNFAALSHDDGAISAIARAARSGFAAVTTREAEHADA